MPSSTALKHSSHSSHASHSTDHFFNYKRAFSRNIGIVTDQEQLLLSKKRVAIPGCGGVGSIHALVLARMGVGHFTIADFDKFELENFNRQFGAKYSTLGEDKVEVLRREILDINPNAVVKVFNEPVTCNNIDEFLREVDLVIDSLDFFAFDARDVVFPTCQQKNIPLLTAAPLGLSSAYLLFTRKSMSYRSYFNFLPSDDLETKSVKFALALAPKGTQRQYMDPKAIDLKSGKGPSHAVGVTLCAATAGAEALKILLGKRSMKPVPHYRQFDAYREKFVHGYLWLGNRNPLQRFKIWFAKRFVLGKNRGTR